ncbi:MAG: ABC transporter substrate-binding protein [Alphaproteobacteria bacterium]|nr:ABC transporter substrate-binding protein [Alphaproteobacteria bacterium]MCB9928525.1 ABC transporter substrate-binding protein [Alphaproteobacteria bacterium]
MGLLRRSLIAAATVAVTLTGAAEAETPKYGGILNFVVGSRQPSFDGHQESTFGVIHPIAPFYSLLIKVNPENPADPTDFVCDVCVGDVPQPTDDGLTYTFPIVKNATFHDGQKLTAHDVVASFNHIINPPKGVLSVRSYMYEMVDSVEATDDYTVVFHLKRPSQAFIPALANPYNWIYSADKLAKDPNWYKTNIDGSGAFKLKEVQAGALISGVKYDKYFKEGRPYLDGFNAIIAPKQSVRVQAIRGGRADIEFRAFPPKARDDLIAALGDQITVQQSTWNCNVSVSLNHGFEPFKDERVRKALTLAIDRWGGSEYLSKIAIMKTVGGIIFPGHPYARSKEELEKMVGYWPDIEKSRAEARRLLKEAGYENLSFDLVNRNVDQPYKIAGTWLIGQWKKIGVTATQRAVPTGEWFRSFRETKNYEAAVTASCQSVVNPLLDTANNLSIDRSPQNYRGYNDAEGDAIYDKAAMATNPEDAKKYLREFEDYIINEKAHYMIVLWWNRIVPYRSYVKGWKISPSHYLGQTLVNVWLDK